MPMLPLGAAPGGPIPAPTEPPCVARAMLVLRSGRGVLLTGPAGIGKSFAARILRRALAADGRSVLSTTASAAIAGVPFGALLPLVPAGALAGQGLEWLTRTADAIRRCLLADPDAVLAVDDAHLLDGPSAGVVQQVALAGLPVVLAMRDGRRAPDALDRLEADAAVERIRVDPLDEPQSAELLQGVLGGAVDARLVAVVHARSEGLPLAVLGHARAARRSGAVALRSGRWTLVSSLSAPAGLAPLVADTLEALPPAARRAAELVALADGLQAVDVASLGIAAAADEAEAAGALVCRPHGALQVAHPLIGDALVAGLTGVRRRLLLTQLMSILADRTDPVGLVRNALWGLELGEPIDPQHLIDLAALTVKTDRATAELFARAAVAAGAGSPGRLRLAQVLAHQHRADEALEVLDDIDLTMSSPTMIAEIAMLRAFLLTFAAARPEEALQVLARIPSDARGPMTLALETTAVLYSGRLGEAAAASRLVAEDPSAGAEARAHAAMTHAASLGWRGRRGDFEAWLPTVQALVAGAANELPEGEGALRLMSALVPLRSELDVRATTALVEQGYRTALTEGDDGDRAQWSHLLGLCALLQGDAAAALEQVRLALGVRGHWERNVGFVTGTLIQALVLTGRLAEADEEYRALLRLPRYALTEVDVRRAVALLAAGHGDLRAAASLAARAAREAEGAPAADAWYDAMRYGHPLGPTRFLSASAELLGPARDAQRMHAAAVLDHDADELSRASAALDRCQLGWYAIDALAQAADEYERRNPGDLLARQRLADLRAQHPTLRSPVGAVDHAPPLTARESEVVRLAAGGASARAIAARLGIGVRTVETHLDHAYRKLGVRSRAELRGFAELALAN